MNHSPADRSALIELVRQFHQEAAPWIPSGLGQHLDWGPDLDPSHAVLSCRHLDRVIDHAVNDLTISVEAGMPLPMLQQLLADQGQWLAMDQPRGCRPSSIGGLVARGLAGGLRQRHLGVRDQIIGISLVRSDGIEARAGGRVVKNVAGYDLMRLLCGSWGSLALITELTLRLQPVRPAKAALVLTGDLKAQEGFRAELMRSTLTPERCDWQSKDEGQWRLRLVLSSVSDQAVEDQLSRLTSLVEDHGLAAERHSCSDLLETDMPCQDPRWLVRVVLPPAAMHLLLDSAAMAALQHWQWDLAAGAGCGDGWSTKSGNGFQVEALRRAVMALGGSLTLLKQPDDSRIDSWLDTPARPLIEAVKRQFDPLQQLCRGRLPGVNQAMA
ncbi:MAG: FAD-binding oxidoreductase [Cyanobacteriota bacterium]|nr:FAD-binding oxidoreductase [Cyanobacteriota bacterium]